MFGQNVCDIYFREVRFVLFHDVIKLSESGTEHPLHFVINVFQSHLSPLLVEYCLLNLTCHLCDLACGFFHLFSHNVCDTLRQG
jgi:hypothetical protein